MPATHSKTLNPQAMEGEPRRVDRSRIIATGTLGKLFDVLRMRKSKEGSSLPDSVASTRASTMSPSPPHVPKPEEGPWMQKPPSTSRAVTPVVATGSASSAAPVYVPKEPMDGARSVKIMKLTECQLCHETLLFPSHAALCYTMPDGLLAGGL